MALDELAAQAKALRDFQKILGKVPKTHFRAWLGPLEPEFSSAYSTWGMFTHLFSDDHNPTFPSSRMNLINSLINNDFIGLLVPLLIPYPASELAVSFLAIN